MDVVGVFLWLAKLIFYAAVVTTVVSPAALPMAMSGAFSSLRISRSSERVLLSGLDGMPFAISLICALIGTGVALGAGAVFGWAQIAAMVAAMFGLAFGSRVRVTVDGQTASCVRSIFWVVPWRRIRFEHVVAWVDGWGDWADPLALYVGEARGDTDGSFVELAWVLGGSASRADELADEFNRAVDEIRSLR